MRRRIIIGVCLVGLLISREGMTMASDSDQLLQSTKRLAYSKESGSLQKLAVLLSDPAFMARLTKDDSYAPTVVFEVLESHPSPQTAQLCITLANLPYYNTENKWLMNYLLHALAAVKPVDEPAAVVFRRTNQEGFFAVNGPILAANGSPRAIAILESMIQSKQEDVPNRLSLIHWSLFEYRTQAGVAQMVQRLLKSGVAPEVEAALLETMFVSSPNSWWGKRTGVVPTPPAWPSVSMDALHVLLELSDIAKNSKTLSAHIQPDVQRASADIQSEIQQRKK